MRRRSSAGALTLGVVMVLTVASCGVPSQSAAEKIPPDQVPFGLVAAGEVSTTTTDVLNPSAATVYLIRADKLVPVERSSSGLGAMDRVAVLAEGPTEAESADGFRSAINDEAVVGGVTVTGPLAVVDFTSRFSELPRGDQLLAVAQLVYTLTEIPGVTELSFRLEGRPTAVPRADGSLSDLPVTPSDYRDLLR
jgi:spore germination protein GerM